MSAVMKVIALIWVVWVILWFTMVVTKVTYRKLTGHNDGRIEKD